MEIEKLHYQPFNIDPFIDDRLICGINALIEVLNLPYEKIRTPDRKSIALKLKEISPADSNDYVSLVTQCAKFQILVEILCDDDEKLIKEIYCVCEEKFKLFLKTGQYV